MNINQWLKSLSVLTAIFQVNLDKLVFIEAKDDGVVVITGATSRAKLQSNHHHQKTNTQFLQAVAKTTVSKQSTVGNG